MISIPVFKSGKWITYELRTPDPMWSNKHILMAASYYASIIDKYDKPYLLTEAYINKIVYGLTYNDELESHLSRRWK